MDSQINFSSSSSGESAEPTEHVLIDFNDTTGVAINIRAESHFSNVAKYLMLFSHYMILIPVFVLCWYVVVNFLKRRGHITQREAHDVMEEVKAAAAPKISLPRRPPMLFTPSNHC